MLATAGLAQADTSAAACSVGCAKDCEDPKSQNLWQPHAFSNYASREILLMKDIDLDVDKEWVTRFGFATEYMQSFNNDSCNGLGALPFWSGTNKMTIGDNSGDYDLDAYQFGMGNLLLNDDEAIVKSGSITLAPNIQHVGTEFMWYLVQNQDKPGLYAKLKLPIGAMIVNTKLCEDPAVLAGTNAYWVEGVGTPPIISTGIAGFPPALYYTSLTEALAGGTSQQHPVYKYGKFNCCNHTTIRLGDMTAAMGANFVVNDKGHFGVGIKVSAPTGNVPTAEYALEPIFGRAGHWGLGGEITGHYKHCMEKEGCYWTAWVQGEVMHLFQGRRPSYRSFDLLANGAGSKYLLLQHYTYNGAGTAFVPGIRSVEQTGAVYVAGDYQPAINLTTLPVKSTFSLEGNFAFMFDFHHNNMNFALGGEFWGRSKECLKIDTCNIPSDCCGTDYNLNDWAVVGRQIGGIQVDDDVFRYWCEPAAKINESLALYTGAADARPEGIQDATVAANRIPAAFDEALDIAGAAAHRVFTGKVLAELGYTWTDHKYVPHVGVFGGAEFAATSSRFPRLWSVGIVGTVQY